MDREQIQELIEKYLLFAEETKSEIEGNKLEFKRDWFKLNGDQVFQCARQVAAIANSIGGGDGFLVFGYDLKEHRPYPTKLSDSTISDPAKIFEAINKRINPRVSFEVIDIIYNGNGLSVIHIQPSTNKPHLLPYYKDKDGKEFRHVTFIRNGSSSDLATKEDFERMYMDRVNLFQDYQLEVSLNYSTLKVTLVPQSNKTEKFLYISVNMHFENYGRRNIALDKIEFEIETYVFEGLMIKLPSKLVLTGNFKNHNSTELSLIVLPNGIIEVNMTFICDGLVANGSHVDDFAEDNLIITQKIIKTKIKNLKVYTSNGKQIVPDTYHKIS